MNRHVRREWRAEALIAVDCTTPAMTGPDRVRLTSWKEIAAHLHREVRTVIRWEKERRLPVHRVPGGQGRSVFAFADELDLWAAGELGGEKPAAAPPPGPLRHLLRPSRRLVVAGLAAIGIVAAVAAGLARPWIRGAVARVTVGESSLEAHAKDGRFLWSFALPGRTAWLPRRHTQVFDLTGDQQPDALASLHLTETSHGAGDGVLYAVDHAGRPLWRRSMEAQLSFGGAQFDGPWQPDDMMAFSSGGAPLVAWALHHHTWWPSILAIFDATGSRLGVFANAGWIRTSEASLDGRHIITGGFSNSRNGAAFAVLDARHPDGSSPEDPGSAYECRNCQPGRPLRYFVIEWSDIATGLPPDERDATVTVYPGDGTIQLRAHQRRMTELIVDLSPTFEVIRRSASDTFWEWHRRLEQDGTLTHGRQACPYRDGPVVREWTPTAGWKTYGVTRR